MTLLQTKPGSDSMDITVTKCGDIVLIDDSDRTVNIVINTQKSCVTLASQRNKVFSTIKIRQPLYSSGVY